MRDPRSKGREGLLLYRTSFRHPFLLYFHSFCSSKRQSPEIQCSIPMILTKLPCNTGHVVHILPSVMSALVFQLTALHRWFLYPSLNCCSLQLLSGSIRMLLCRRTIILISPSVLCHYNLPGQHIQLTTSTSFPVQKVSFKIMYAFQTCMLLLHICTTSCFSHKHR